MDTRRWQRLQQLFEAALEQPEEARGVFLDQACGDDAALRRAVERLLREDATSDQALHAGIGAAAAEVAMSRSGQRLGERLGAWRIVSHIADGGMGAVYLAERADGEYQQRAAVKLLNPAFVSASAKARLEAERQILAGLTHPNIAGLLDGGRTEDGVPYLVLEYVDGEPIDAWCDRQGLDTAARLRLMAKVCRAVDYAHRNLVVHRDLKPSNILVDARGEPQLLDFGIAKLVEGGVGLTRSGHRVLTPSHASPEQITGGPVTTATDIYALGVLLYELLAGRAPYASEPSSAVALAREIVEGQPSPPSSAVTGDSSRRIAAARERGERLTPARLARELAGDLDNIVLMALRKEPERRYASAEALAEDLERSLAHLPVRARPDSLGYRTAKFLRRHRVAVPVSAVALLFALGSGAWFTWRLAEERDTALAAEARATKAADFTASVLGRTSASQDASRLVSVRELLDRAAQRLADELGDEPEVALRVGLALGDAYASWGEYEEGYAHALAALELAETLGAQRQEAIALRLLGTVTHGLGRLDESLHWTERAEAAWRRAGTPAEYASALSDLALTLNGLRRRTEAEPVFREALVQLRRAHEGDHGDIAWALNNMAWGLHAMGRLDEAAPLYEEALAMQERLGSPLYELAQTRKNLAGLHFDRGDLALAETMWRETLAEFESVFGSDGHAAVAMTQGLLARVALLRGDTDEAMRLARLALEINRAAVGERHRWTARALYLQGLATLQAGQLDTADEWLQQSLAVRQEVLPPGHSEFAQAHLGLGLLALARGDAAAAERELRTGREVVAALPSPDRVPIDEIELALARAVALQGRDDEGLAVATEAVARMQTTVAPGHWRRRAAEAMIGLPPLLSHPDDDALAHAQEALAQLREQLGPDAPLVHELAAALAAQAHSRGKSTPQPPRPQ
jgi:serine/threonine-protein kinase